MLSKNFKTRLPLAVITGLSLGILILVITTSLNAYSQPKGLLLSDGSIMGGDFICFYTAGVLANQQLVDLYDLQKQFDLKDKILLSYETQISGELPFVYPPLLAFVFSVLAKLPFPTAYFTWISCGLVISALALLSLMQSLDIKKWSLRVFYSLTILGFLPYTMNTFGGGQLSWIGLSAMCIVTVLLRKKMEFLAGLCLCAGYYKPPIFLLAGILLTLTRTRYFFLGELVGATMLTILTISYVGMDGLLKYIEVASRYTYGQELTPGVMNSPAQAAGPLGFLAWFVTENSNYMTIYYLTLFGICVFSYILITKAQRNLDLISAYIWTVSLTFSLQLVRYDLAMLVVPGLLVANSKPCRAHYPWILLLHFAAFYLEFLGRGMKFGDMEVSLSSFLLISWSLTMYLIAKKLTLNPAAPHATHTAQCPQKHHSRC